MKVWSLCGSALSWHSLVSENKPPLVQQRLLRKIVDYQLFGRMKGTLFVHVLRPQVTSMQMESVINKC